MRPMVRLLLFLLLASFGAVNALSGESDPHAADRQALIAIFHEMEAAINAQDVERMIAQMSPEVTVTWLNGEVSRGHDQVRAYYRKMVRGDDRILDRYLTSARIGAPARFFADGTVAVADGTMVDQFFPVARGPFSLDSNWTTTLARIDGKWKVVSLHLSANVVTNSLMAEAKAALWWVAAGAGAAGVLLGLLIGWMRRRR